MSGVEAILWDAEQCGVAIGVTAATFRRMVDDGRIPKCIQHRSTFGQERCRRYSVRLLKLWAANVDIENLDPVDLALHDLTPAPAPGLPPATGWPDDERAEDERHEAAS